MTDAGASPRVDVDAIKARLRDLSEDLDNGAAVEDAAPTLCFQDIPALLAENERLQAEQTYVAGRGIKAESQLAALRLVIAGIRADLEPIAASLDDVTNLGGFARSVNPVRFCSDLAEHVRAVAAKLDHLEQEHS